MHCLHMIEQRAERNQRACPVKVLAAYYGHKDSIKQMVSQKLVTGDPLESECSFEP